MRPRTTRSSTGDAADGFRAELAQAVHDIVDHPVRDTGVHTDPERTLHNEIGIREIPYDAMRNVPIGRLAQQVAGKELPKWASDIDVTSWAQFFLKYDISHPVVTAAIPGTTKVSHLEDNQKAARGRVPDADMREKMVKHWESIST
jgi:diketogulonate reductase-like aldo/keto reductase